jgi:hypothetical protein
MSQAAILIPTLRRPESLARTLRSLLAQAGLAARVSEIVVADNDPDASARVTVDAFQAAATVPLRYVHVPRPGVATARNAALAATAAPLIVFIDDDEEAEPGWLDALLDAHARLGADVTFGPIRGSIPDPTHWAHAYLERLFGREGPAVDGLSEKAWGCGNSVMTRATALPGAAPFETAADQTGGEDDILFERLRARGGRFGWAASAWVVEHAPAHRATLAYALHRAFAYGQSPCQEAARRRAPLSLARWMAVGAAQTLVFGALAVGLTLAARPERADMLDRAARGLGKVLWMKRFEPRFYGQAALRQSDRAAAGASVPAPA